MKKTIEIDESTGVELLTAVRKRIQGLMTDKTKQEKVVLDSIAKYGEVKNWLAKMAQCRVEIIESKIGMLEDLEGNIIEALDELYEDEK